MKIDLIADCSKLAAQIEVLASSQTQLGQKAQASLRQLVTASQALLHLMRQVNENYLDLTSLSVADNRWTQARGFWEALPAGKLDPTQIDDLVKKCSPVLGSLYRASIDFRSITKFSDAELAFAREIGDEFQRYKRFWARLKKIVADGRPFRIVHEREARGAIGFFQLLLRHALVLRCEARFKRAGGDTKVDLTGIAAELKRTPLDEKDRLEIVFEFDRRYQSVLTGGWFEAYSYLVFINMLDRLAADFEVYSRVEYEATVAAKAMSRGDIDLLVSLHGQIIMVECKSAELSDEDAARVIAKTRFLKEVFAGMGVKETLFMLVCAPSDADETQAAIDRVESEGIEVVEPQDIRTFLSKKLVSERAAATS
jgi:Holliday junction resolvase-like predicted endonuclease